MKEEFIKICSDIKKNNCCNDCSGDFDNYICKYCGNENLQLGELLNSLNSLLLNIDNYDRDILDSLYSIRGLNVEKVNDILVKNDYDKKLEGRYFDICSKIFSDDLSWDNYHDIIYFLNNDLFVRDNKNFYINYLMKKMLLNRLDVKIDDKLELIKQFTEMFMKEKVMNPKCNFGDLENNVGGTAIFDLIELDKKVVTEFGSRLLYRSNGKGRTIVF